MPTRTRALPLHTQFCAGWATATGPAYLPVPAATPHGTAIPSHLVGYLPARLLRVPAVRVAHCRKGHATTHRTPRHHAPAPPPCAAAYTTALPLPYRYLPWDPRPPHTTCLPASHAGRGRPLPHLPPPTIPCQQFPAPFFPVTPCGFWFTIAGFLTFPHLPILFTLRYKSSRMPQYLPTTTLQSQ